jgi:hypothetical protein
MGRQVGFEAEGVKHRIRGKDLQARIVGGDFWWELVER